MLGADWTGFGVLSLDTQRFEPLHHWLRDESQAEQVEREARGARLPKLVDQLVADRELVIASLDQYSGWAEESAD